MAIWFFLKESVLILLATILTTSFSADFSKVLTKVKFSPENSIALNEFLEQLLIQHEKLEWVDKLQTQFKYSRLSNSGLEMRKMILKRNDRRYRKRRKLRPYYYRNYRKNLNFKQDEISHLNIDDYENALTGVLKKEGYKQQRVKQKRYIMEDPPVTPANYKDHTTFDLLDLSIPNWTKKDKDSNDQPWIGNNNLRKKIAKNKSKKQISIPDDYLEYTESSTSCSAKPTVYAKPAVLEDYIKLVETTTKKQSTKTRNWLKNKTVGIMNSKKKELTITKLFDARRKNSLSSKNEFESSTSPTIAMKSISTEKPLEKKSITKLEPEKTTKENEPVDMIPKKTIILSHSEKNIILNKTRTEQQVDASPTNSKIKSINLDKLHIITDPNFLEVTKTTVTNLAQPNKLQKRENIVEEDPASVMSPEEIRRAKIEEKKLMDVDKDFNERNEPGFNKDLMKTKIEDYKEVYDYWENLKDKVNQIHKSNNIRSVGKILNSEEKREIKHNENKHSSFFSRQLLNYNYDNDYYDKLYSDYDDQENTLRRYPRDLNENYKFQNLDDDYFNYRNEPPLERRFYKKRWKKEADNKNNEKGMISKNELKSKIKKLKNFFGFGHENNYNENIEDDYPLANMPIDDYTAKKNDFIDDNKLKMLSKNLEILQTITKPQDAHIFQTENSFDPNIFGQNSLSRMPFETKIDKSSISSNSNKKNVHKHKFYSQQNKQNSLKQSFFKEIQDNNHFFLEQSTLPTKPTTSLNEPEKQNPILEDWYRNLKISSIIDATFPNDLSHPSKKPLKPIPEKTTNTHTSSPGKLMLYDFTSKLGYITTPSDPIYYSFDDKMNLFDPKSSSDLSKEIVNFRGKLSKRELSFLKNLIARYKAKKSSKINSETQTVKLNDHLANTPIYDKKNIDKFLFLNNNMNKKKLTNKYKFHLFPNEHSELKELLKDLPPQIPDAQMHVDELKLDAIKKHQKQNKKTNVNVNSREATDYREDLDEDDYISSDDFKNVGNVNLNDDEQLKRPVRIVKHDVKNSANSERCGKMRKSHKNRFDLEEKKNAIKIAGRPKTEDNKNAGDRKKQGKIKSNKDKEMIKTSYEINVMKDRKILNDVQKTKLIDTDRNVLKHSCSSNTTKKSTSSVDLIKKCSITATKCPIKKSSSTETCETTTTCKTTTCPTTCKTTTCRTTRRRTTCPTTCKTTTCRTTRKRTTCPTSCRTTCPTTCRTTCPTTCRTTCPTTCRTTCPTTCKTTCPTTRRRTTCPTTCKTTTCPTTCKTTTCPTTTRTTCPTTTSQTTCPTTCSKTTSPTTCKTTCPTTQNITTCSTTGQTTTCPTTPCENTTSPTTTSTTATTACPSKTRKTKTTKCTHLHSTHKIEKSLWCNTNNFMNNPNRKLIQNSKYFDNEYHAAKFNADRHPRHLIFPKKKYLHRDMPKNEYQEMKHKNLINRLRRKYFPKQNKHLPEKKEDHFIRRKKSINLNDNVIPIYKIYPKKIRYQRYRRRKMKSDEEEDEKQRKVLETIYHHRIQRRRNEPEYVRKSHSYIGNNDNLPSSYDDKAKKMLIRRNTCSMKKDDFKGTTSSDSSFNADAVKGKIAAQVVQDLFMDLSKSKNIKNVIGKILRNPNRDPNNLFPDPDKCAKEKAAQQLQQILSDFMKQINNVKVTNGNCAGLNMGTKLFLKIITANIKQSDGIGDEDADIPAQSMILFTENVSNSSTSNPNSTTTIKDGKNATALNASAITTTAKSTATNATKVKPTSTNKSSSSNTQISGTKLSDTSTKSTLIELCKTIIVTSDPFKYEAYATERPTTTTKSCTTKTSTTKTCKTQSSTNKSNTNSSAAGAKTKETKSTTSKSTTIKASKSTKTKCKNTSAFIQKSPIVPTEMSKNKMWENPLKLKIEVFKEEDNTNCSSKSDTAASGKAQTQTKNQFGAEFKRRIGVKRSQMKSPLTVHKVLENSDAQANIHKIPLTHRELTNLLAMYNNLSATERKRNKYIYNYLHTQKLFLERLMYQFTNYNRRHRNIKLRKRQNFHKRRQHLVWVSNDPSGSSDDSKYIKLKKRIIIDNQMKNFRSRMKRENYFRDVMKTRRMPDVTYTKMDEWMNVKNEEQKPQHLNFTF